MQLQYTEKAREALKLAEKCARDLKQGYVGCEHLLAGLLQEGSGVAAKVLGDNGVEEERVREMVREMIAFEGNVTGRAGKEYSPRLSKVLEEAHRLASRFEEKQIGTEHLLMGLIKEGDNVALRLLATINVAPQKLYSDCLAAIGQDPNLYKEDLGRKQTGQSATPTLDQYSRDLTELAREGRLDPVVGREEEIRRVIRILSRRAKNNPCLIGEPGVGKTAVVEGLAQRIVEGNVPFTVADKRLLTLDLSAMVAGSKYRGEFEERIKRVMAEVMEAGNVLLFLDELHTIIGAGGAEGAIDAANILKPALARGEVQLIGATTIAEYRKYVEKDAALERRFQPVNINEPTEEEAIRILMGIKGKYESHHRVTILPEAVEAAVRLSNRYINDRNLPDKAIDLIDEAAANVRLTEGAPGVQGELADQVRELDRALENAICREDFAQASAIRRKQEGLIERLERSQRRKNRNEREEHYEIGEDDIEAIVAAWTRIPVQKLAEKESERLMKLESILHKRVIGQEQAVHAVARAMRRGRVGLKDPKRPIGSFLFLGPTGVGKTELSKALAEAMFGTEDSLIRVDMSEYMEGHSVSKMIGSPPGYVGFEDGGQLSEKVRRNPYSVVLFDEIEKAHPDVFNILLQVLDDGHITDSKGRRVDFKNTILIMTSNAGAQRIIEPKNLGFATQTDAAAEHERMKNGVMEEVKKSFKPEFINRIDDIIVFHQLNRENMKDIINLLSSGLKKRCENQMNITLTLTGAMKEYLVEKYSDVKMGARPLKRALQSVVEDSLAEELLTGRAVSGDKVSVGVKNGRVTFTVKNKR